MRWLERAEALAGWCWLLSAVWLVSLIALQLLHQNVRRPRFEAAGIAFVALLFIVAALRLFAGPPRLPSRAIDRRLLWIPVLAAALPFVWALSLGPLSDDYVLGAWARSGTLSTPEWGPFRPVPLLVWAVALKAGAGWPLLHAVNIACHSATAGLLAVLGLRVFRSRAAALAAGVSFALYPASLEAVAWTAGVFDGVATLSIVAAVVVFVAGSYGRLNTAVLAGLTMVALLSKETGMMLPLFLFFATPLAIAVAGQTSNRWFVPVIVSALIVGVYLVARHSAAGEVLAMAAPQGRWQLKNMLVRPYAALALPFHQTVGAMLPAVAGLCIVSLFLGARGARSIEPERPAGAAAIVAGLAWGLLGAIPLLSNFFVGPDLQGSRYAYLPLAGFALAIGGALEASHDSRLRWLRLTAVGCLLLTWLWAWPAHVAAWTAAARLRDTVLTDAQRLVHERRCSSLRVQGAPDNVMGAYVFRVGLDKALSTLVYTPAGAACTAEWRGESLTPSK